MILFNAREKYRQIVIVMQMFCCKYINRTYFHTLFEKYQLLKLFAVQQHFLVKIRLGSRYIAVRDGMVVNIDWYQRKFNICKPHKITFAVFEHFYQAPQFNLFFLVQFSSSSRSFFGVWKAFLSMLLIKLVVIQKNLWSVHNTFSPIGTVERHMPYNFSSIMVLLYCCWSSLFRFPSIFPFYFQMHSTLEANKIFMCIVQQHFD